MKNPIFVRQIEIDDTRKKLLKILNPQPENEVSLDDDQLFRKLPIDKQASFKDRVAGFKQEVSVVIDTCVLALSCMKCKKMLVIDYNLDLNALLANATDPGPLGRVATATCLDPGIVSSTMANLTPPRDVTHAAKALCTRAGVCNSILLSIL